ncbi:hypothetical protein BT63DRAFT_435957 [Microthyrium microscopicum]|uniref:RING-type domain-containing protein n=1 Tax=Microthyrium microscopicum TaxID=703497 RepID=A0A6A6URK1_9PEZI|nr:hypothetical protein BT63DRAFT_435957 [Microthyrium microscopicum]
MGTPGALRSRILDGSQCEHKLPTSCVLTSTQECCACEDERDHVVSYNIYIDGAGMKPWGTRWQDYCWPCKEFWNNRTGRGIIPPSQTRIPEIPDQSLFLERWYDFYRGYSTTSTENGVEITYPIQHEPWRDVDPGRLPRTTDEVRQGLGRSQYEIYIDSLLQHRHENMNRAVAEAPVSNLEETLDALMEDAEDEVHVIPSESVAPSSGRLHSFGMDHNFDLTHTEISNIPPLEPVVIPSPPAIEGYSEQAGTHLAGYPLRLLSIMAEDEADSAETASGPSIPGTPEPENIIPPQDTANSHHVPPEESSSLMSSHDGVWEALSRLREARERNTRDGETAAPATMAQIMQELREQRYTGGSRGREHFPALLELLRDSRDWRRSTRSAESSTFQSVNRLGLDSLPRPPPLEDEQLTVKLDCRICLTQIAKIACIPCGHVVMCQWCADIQMPLMPESTSTPRTRASQCPECRGIVRQRSYWCLATWSCTCTKWQNPISGRSLYSETQVEVGSD